MNTIAASAADDPRERRALARFAAVQAVLQARQHGLSLTRALHETARQPWDGRYYSAETLENWLYRFEHGHFAALHDQPRSDRGQKRALDPALTEALLSLRRQHPEMTLHSLTQELLRQGVLQPGTFSESTLQRRLAEAGLDRRSLRAGAALIGGPTKAFEYPLPNLLWMADGMHGPSLKLPDASTQRTFLFALLDDHSRLCVHASSTALNASSVSWIASVRPSRPWRPAKLTPTTVPPSASTPIVCQPRIKLLPATTQLEPGKIERFSSPQTQFLPSGTSARRLLEDLNRASGAGSKRLSQRPHAALQDQPRPALRGRRPPCPRRRLQRLFLMRVHRRVRKDTTISRGPAWEARPSPRQWSPSTRSGAGPRRSLAARPIRRPHPLQQTLNAQTRTSNAYHRFDA
jgi:hypothetical protein